MGQPIRIGNPNDLVGYARCGLAGLFEPSRISKKARAAIENSRQRADGLAVSDITLLEIAAIENKGRIKLNVSLEAFLAEVESRFIVMPMTGHSAPVLWHYRRLIRRTRPTELLEQPRLSKGFL